MAAVGGYWYGWRVLERPVLQRCFEHDVGVGIGMLANALSSDDRCAIEAVRTLTMVHELR